MFVTKSRFDKADAALRMTRLELSAALDSFNNLKNEWNELVSRINKLGGEDFLQNAKIHAHHPTRSFKGIDIKDLLKLCHPDLHQNNPLASEVTRKLLELKNK